MKIKVLMCYHDLYPHIANDIIEPISVKIAEGDNISHKGNYYSELRVLYWAWKNVHADIIGIFHYRRFLNLKNSITQFYSVGKDFYTKYGLTTNRIEMLMQQYDVILPQKVPHRIKATTPTVYEYYIKEHYQEDIDLTLDILAKKYPEMRATAQKMIKSAKQSFCANLIITKKELFDEYAQWLFGILFEVEKIIKKDVVDRNPYQQRVFGFLSERLLGVFIEYKKETENIKVCEAPLLFWESNLMKYLKYLWRETKRNFLLTIGLGRKEWKIHVE